MELRHLSALMAVADHGSFSAAASVLHTVQSNVSTLVARLERELGVTLWDRQAAHLTPEGVAVVERARHIDNEVAAISADLAALGDEITGTVRFGVIDTTARWLVVRLLDAVSTHHPGIDMQVTAGLTSLLVPRVVDTSIDLAVVTLPAGDPDVVEEPLFEEHLELVVPITHRLAGAEGVDLTDLDGLELMLPAPDTVLRHEIDAAARRADITLEPVLEVDGMRLLASLAFAGHAPALLPASAAPGWLEGPWTRVSVTGLPRRRVGLVARRRGRPIAAVDAVRQAVRDVVTARLAEDPPIGRAVIA